MIMVNKIKTYIEERKVYLMSRLEHLHCQPYFWLTQIDELDKVLKLIKGDQMNSQILKIVKLFDDVDLPTKQNITDSGFDLYAHSFKRLYQSEQVFEGDNIRLSSDKTVEVCSGDRILIGTGIKATIGEGYELQVRPRSGLALKQGLTVLNTPGTIDESYFDEIGVILINLSTKVQAISLHTRIAQLVACPIILPKIEIVSELIGNNRGGGFGHTGVK